MFFTDGFRNRYVYTLWFGPNEMSNERTDCLLSIIKNNGCPNVHINYSTLARWIHPDFPIHGIFPYLSPVHQSDYLRCYFLHVYGGGYTDIKRTSIDWRPLFEELESSDSWGAGYTEISPNGVAPVGGDLELSMKKEYQTLIGFCAMLFKPRTPLTKAWLDSIHTTFNEKYELAKKNPARHILDQTGIMFSDNSISCYPFSWTELGGNIFHPLVFKNKDKIKHFDAIAPSFTCYR